MSEKPLCVDCRRPRSPSSGQRCRKCFEAKRGGLIVTGHMITGWQARALELDKQIARLDRERKDLHRKLSVAEVLFPGCTAADQSASSVNLRTPNADLVNPLAPAAETSTGSANPVAPSLD